MADSDNDNRNRDNGRGGAVHDNAGGRMGTTTGGGGSNNDSGSFKLQYRLCGCCLFSPRRVVNEIGWNTTPVSIP